jgi:hypothetical protein
MITIEIHNPNPLLLKYIRKISVFRSKKPITYRQKLTPSAFTCISYNQRDIPVSIFGKRRVHPERRLQIAGPKINEHIYVQYNGTLEQILIECTIWHFSILRIWSNGNKNVCFIQCFQLERNLILKDNIYLEDFRYNK